jgi:Na+-driven multidrug efflux pump
MSTDVIAAHPLRRLPGPANSADAMLNAPILPTLVRLSLPNMLAMLAMALVAIAETAFVGSLGTPPLAGLALAFPLVMLQQMMSGGAMGGGVSSAISRALGAGDERRAFALALHALVIGCAFGALATITMLIFGEPIYRLLGGRDGALNQALAYSSIVFLGATGIWLTNMLAAVVRAGGNMRLPSVAMMVTSVMHVVLAGALGFGWGVDDVAFPKLGMTGIAAGQVIAYSGCALFLLWYLNSGRTSDCVGIISGISSGSARWPASHPYNRS